jgi:signal transduction histidine kinase
MRWLINTLGVILALGMVCVLSLKALFANHYYSNMRSDLYDRAESTADFFADYLNQSYNEYYQSCITYAQTFGDKDRLELQFINSQGQIVQSTSGLTSGSSPATEDVHRAIETHNVASWAGRSPETRERIMAASSPIISNGHVRGVMRVVTSLTLIDRQILLMVSVITVIAAVVITLVYLVNMYFIRSVITPLSRITETAKGIANGSYGIQIEKQYDDEVGDLIDAINNMSSKINQTEKMKSEFISSVSHELRTPLTAINGWSETLLTGEISDEESVHKGLSIIASEGQRLSKMVEELLEFSRIEDGRFTLNIEDVDIQAEFEDAIFTYRQFYRKKNIRLEYRDTAGDLAPIPGDPERLRQVFSNVLDNAAKHGGEDQLIQASLGVENDKVVIRIRDHGPGVLEKDLPHLKEMFYKATSKVRGSGIGLSVCDEIVTRHGGSLDIANAKGGGCVVTISLPMSQPAPQG